jgi:hypothetical protein
MINSVAELLGILPFAPDCQTCTASTYIHMPWVGPEAYLHTIFAPAAPACLKQVSEELRIPKLWQAFLERQNGANLYLNSLYIYGAVEANLLIDRSGVGRVPFNILELNAEANLSPKDEWLQIGNYGFRGSRVLLSRRDGCVRVVDLSSDKTLVEWLSTEVWLGSELKRLSALYSSEGRLLTDERLTEPSPPRHPN